MQYLSLRTILSRILRMVDGGTNLLEKIFWLWSLAFKPEYRKSEIWDIWNGVLIIGLAGTVVVIACCFIWWLRDKKKLPMQYLLLIGISIFSTLLWSFTTGISRYYMIGRLLWGLLAFGFVLIAAEKFRYVGKFMAAVCLSAAVLCTALNLIMILMGRNWSWDKWSWSSFKTQMEKAFHDNDIKTDYKLDADLFILTNHMSMGVAELIDDEIYSMNTNYFGNVSSIDGRSLMAEKINESKSACDIHSRVFANVREYIENLNNNNLYAVNVESIDLSIGTYEIFSLENTNGRKNTVWTSEDGELELDVSELQGQKHLKFIGGRIYDWPVDPVKLEISVSDGIDERQAAEIYLDNSDINLFDIVLELTENDSMVTIIPRYGTNGEVVETTQINKAFLINARVE